MQDSNNTRNGKEQQVFYILAPFLLLSVCIIAINLVRAMVPAPPSTPVDSGAISTPQQTDVETTAETRPLDTPLPPATLPATLSAVPTPTPTPTVDVMSLIPEDANVQLLGPPHGSIFAANDTLSFYWTWPLPTADDQFFAVYVYDEEQRQLLGQLDSPNLGTAYVLHHPAHEVMSEIFTSSGTIQWQIVLHSTFTASPLVASEPRTFTIIDN